MIRITIFLASMLTFVGCDAPTSPTPAGVKAWIEPDTVRIVSEVDHLPDYHDPVSGKCPVGTVPKLKAAIHMRDKEPVGLSFLVLKCAKVL